VAVGAAVGTTIVGVAGAGVIATVAVGALDGVGVAPLDAQAATVARSPPMRATLEILNRASGCPIMWTLLW
jgi:hypothetical protein